MVVAVQFLIQRKQTELEKNSCFIRFPVWQYEKPTETHLWCR